MDVSNPTSEKAEVEQLQDVAKHNLGSTGEETGSEVIPGSFADVDEKKVLRKVFILLYPQHRTSLTQICIDGH
jgi:hypothetical protein